MNQQPSAAPAHLQSVVERLEKTGHSGLTVTHFARAVLGVDDPELDCDACQIAIAEYIEAELNNRLDRRHHAIRRHLDLCSACAAIYVDLLEIALLAERGPLPRPDIDVDLTFWKYSP